MARRSNTASSADGCQIGAGSKIVNSVIGLRCRIGRNVTIRNSVIMGADFYETPEQLEANRKAGRPPIGIGDGTVIDNAIVDKNCHVGANAQVVGNPLQIERICGEGWEMLDGLLIVAKSTVLRDGWHRPCSCPSFELLADAGDIQQIGLLKAR